MPKLIRLIAAGLLLLLAVPWAAALELGDLQVRSRLGQPFVGEIPVRGDLYSQIGPDCVRLVRPLADSALPGLTGVAIHYATGPQGGLLRLLGTDKVLDPALQVSVLIGCGANLQRDYLIVLDLPAGPGETAVPATPLAATPAGAGSLAPPAAAPARPKASPQVRPPHPARPAVSTEARAIPVPKPIERAAPPPPTPDATAPATTPSPPPAAAAVPPAPDTRAADGSPWITLGLVLLILSLVLAIWYQHRRNMLQLTGLAGVPPPDEDEFSQAAPLQRPLPPAAGASSLAAPAPVAAPAARPSEEEMPLVPAQLQCEYLMDLTDVMLSFGETQRALKTLQDFVQEHPDEALAPWLRLLELMRVHGKREEFEDLARKVHKAFNIPAPAWEAPPAGDATRSLEDFAHVRQRLLDSWGSQACLDYLDALMRDNRSGQRQGFPLPVMEEMILLRDILGQRLQTP